MHRKGHSQFNRGGDRNKETKVSYEISKGPDKSCCGCCSNVEVK